MIGRLTGHVAHKGDDHVLLDVGGVAYVVYCSDRTLAALPAPGGPARLWTELLVREDLMQLFGFQTLIEKEWHRLLLSVQGVGAKASLAILGTLGHEQLGRAIALGDWGSIKAARGIGPKTAQRVVNELKDKAPAVMAMAPSGGAAQGDAAPVASNDAVIEAADTAQARPAPEAPAPVHSAQADALSALSNLGYAPADAARAVAQAAADGTPDGEAPALIRAALRLLAPKG